jgi:hypothetical protein
MGLEARDPSQRWNWCRRDGNSDETRKNIEKQSDVYRYRPARLRKIRFTSPGSQGGWTILNFNIEVQVCRVRGISIHRFVLVAECLLSTVQFVEFSRRSRPT